MKNLTPRKNVLGILMVLVLAFSVQGIADALTFGTNRSGDFQTVLPNDDFKITFSVSLKSPQAVNKATSKATSTDIDYAAQRRTRPAEPNPPTANYTVIVDSDYTAGDTHYYTVKTTQTVTNTNVTPNRDYIKTTNTRNWLTEDEAYYYNAEQVTIATTGGTLKKVGNYNAPSDSILKETGEDGAKLSSSTTLTFTAPSSASEIVITITDTTDNSDYPTTIVKPTSQFTVYAVKPNNPLTSDTLTLADGTEIYTHTKAVARSDQIDRHIDTTGTTASIPLEFKVEGGGRLYVREDGRGADQDKQSQSRTTLSTSSDAKVWLDMRGNTNKVTAWISGTNPTVTGRSVIYIHGYAQLTITEGNNQTGGARRET